MRGATLRQLRAFSLVAHHRSFLQAAAELHLTPSAVSMQIKELELIVQGPLFGRTGKAVRLTRAGEILLVDVHRALQALQHAEDALARLRDNVSGVVSIGMVSSTKYFLPRLLAQFHEQQPDVELSLSVGNREQLLERLRRGQVDIAIMGEPPVELEASAVPFAPQPLGIVASPEHALAQEHSIPVTALSTHDFIVREAGSGTLGAMERFFRTAAIEPPRLMEMTSNGVIKQAVMANMGLGFLSLHAASLELREHLLVALDVVGLPMVRRWYAVNMDGNPLKGAAAVLRHFILEHGGTSIAQQFGGFDYANLVVKPNAVTHA
jgi:DNA-binding transcriptional LysR family regulator